MPCLVLDGERTIRQLNRAFALWLNLDPRATVGLRLDNIMILRGQNLKELWTGLADGRLPRAAFNATYVSPGKVRTSQATALALASRRRPGARRRGPWSCSRPWPVTASGGVARGSPRPRARPKRNAGELGCRFARTRRAPPSRREPALAGHPGGGHVRRLQRREFPYPAGQVRRSAAHRNEGPPWTSASSATSSASPASGISPAPPRPAAWRSRRCRRACATSRRIWACWSSSAATGSRASRREGERVLAWAQRILADCDALEQELVGARKSLRGRITIGVIPSALAMVAAADLGPAGAPARPRRQAALAAARSRSSAGSTISSCTPASPTSTTSRSGACPQPAALPRSATCCWPRRGHGPGRPRRRSAGPRPPSCRSACWCPRCRTGGSSTRRSPRAGAQPDPGGRDRSRWRPWSATSARPASWRSRPTSCSTRLGIDARSAAPSRWRRRSSCTRWAWSSPTASRRRRSSPRCGPRRRRCGD